MATFAEMMTGSESKGKKRNRNKKGLKYRELSTALREDPLYKQLGWRGKQFGARDLFGMGMASAKSAADQQVAQLQAALGARGGGNLASALAMGSQARQPLSQAPAIAAGMQANQLATISSIFQAKYAPLLNLYGVHMGYQGTRETAKAGVEQAKWGAMGQVAASAISS